MHVNSVCVHIQIHLNLHCAVKCFLKIAIFRALFIYRCTFILISCTFFIDYASRGQKKFGDKCENTLECGFPGSICDAKKKSCQCTEDLPVTNHIDKCGKGLL